MRARNGTRTHQQGAAIYTYETSSLFPNLCFFQHQQCTDSSLPDTSQASVGTSRNKTLFKLKCAGKKCVEAHREQHSRNPKHDDVWFFCLLTLHSLWSVTGFPPISSSPNPLFFLFCVSAPLLRVLVTADIHSTGWKTTEKTQSWKSLHICKSMWVKYWWCKSTVWLHWWKSHKNFLHRASDYYSWCQNYPRWTSYPSVKRCKTLQ